MCSAHAANRMIGWWLAVVDGDAFFTTSSCCWCCCWCCFCRRCDCPMCKYNFVDKSRRAKADTISKKWTKQRRRRRRKKHSSSDTCQSNTNPTAYLYHYLYTTQWFKSSTCNLVSILYLYSLCSSVARCTVPAKFTQSERWTFFIYRFCNSNCELRIKFHLRAYFSHGWWCMEWSTIWLKWKICLWKLCRDGGYNLLCQTSKVGDKGRRSSKWDCRSYKFSEIHSEA